MEIAKKVIKNLLPPIIINLYKSLSSSKITWNGEYRNWIEAKNKTIGYDTDKILDMVRKAALRVKIGECAFERDSVLFDEVNYNWPLLAGLLETAVVNNGDLRVLDFGGSLGSAYFQNKKFLERIPKYTWSIVEQKHFVAVGKLEFENNHLKFYYSVQECIKEENPNALVLSSVLQYLEYPFEALNQILQHKFETIIIERTPFSRKRDIIKIQRVPSAIYKCSYPCWFFNIDNFVKYFEEKDYLLLDHFLANEDYSSDYEFRCMIWRKK